MKVSEALEKRISTNFFDKTASISDDEIKQMVRLASESPTSFNSQNWHVIAVTDPVVKKKLRAVAWDQAKVEEAAVTFAILGNTRVTEKISESVGMAVSNKVIDEEKGNWFKSAATEFYKGKDQLSRDEAIRSASYLAMSLMLVAKERGYATGPMIGFDPVEVPKLLKVPEHWVVTVLLACGPAADKGNWDRKPRLQDNLSLNSF